MYIDFIAEILSGLVIFWQKVSFNIDMVYETVFNNFFISENLILAKSDVAIPLPDSLWNDYLIVNLSENGLYVISSFFNLFRKSNISKYS